MIDLSIIIVSYDTKDYLKECLHSLLRDQSKKFSYEIIVVDNASKDRTLEMVEKEFPKVILVKNKDNFGFSKANNIGVSRSHGRYVLFLNPDTIIYPNTLDVMISFMDKHEDVGIATCKVIMPNGKLDDSCHRGFPTPWNSFCYFTGLSRVFSHSKLFNGYNLGWKNLNEDHEIDACAGAFMIVCKEAGESLKWWDEDYFWYGEDLDFCYRLKRKGLKIYFVPQVSVLHYKGVSGGIKVISKHLTTADEKTRIRATKERFEAMKIFYKKHYEDIYPRFLSWFVYKGIALKEHFASI